MLNGIDIERRLRQRIAETKDDKIICDRCNNYECSASGTTQVCHAQKQGDQVCSPWISDYYRDDRFNGLSRSCKGFNKV